MVIGNFAIFGISFDMKVNVTDYISVGESNVKRSNSPFPSINPL